MGFGFGGGGLSVVAQVAVAAQRAVETVAGQGRGDGGSDRADAAAVGQPGDQEDLRHGFGVGGERDPAEQLLLVRLAQLAALDRAPGRVVEVLPAAGQRVVVEHRDRRLLLQRLDHLAPLLRQRVEPAFDEQRLAVGQEFPRLRIQAHHDPDRAPDDPVALLGKFEDVGDRVDRLVQGSQVLAHRAAHITRSIHDIKGAPAESL